MTCTVEQRRRHRAVADALDAYPSVASVDRIGPQDDPSGRWTTEIVIRERKVPPGVLAVVGGHGLGIASADQRGEPTHTVAVVR